MITHDGAWNLWLLIFFLPFWKQTRNGLAPKVTVVKLSTPTSSDESFAAWIVDPCEGFLRKVSVGQERYWNMNKWWINGSSETWNFLLWKKLLFSQRISALGFSTFLHVSPNEPHMTMAAQVFQFPAAGDNESSAAIAARDPKNPLTFRISENLCSQSVDVRPKKTWCVSYGILA